MLINPLQVRILATFFNACVDLEVDPCKEGLYWTEMLQWCRPNTIHNKIVDKEDFFNQIEGLVGMGILKQDFPRTRITLPLNWYHKVYKMTQELLPRPSQPVQQIRG